jgi:hypothetical protein
MRAAKQEWEQRLGELLDRKGTSGREVSGRGGEPGGEAAVDGLVER